MTDERYNDLMNNQDLKLTSEEINEGWYWCPDCDYLLTKQEDCCLNYISTVDDLDIIF